MRSQIMTLAELSLFCIASDVIQIGWNILEVDLCAKHSSKHICSILNRQMITCSQVIIKQFGYFYLGYFAHVQSYAIRENTVITAFCFLLQMLVQSEISHVPLLYKKEHALVLLLVNSFPEGFLFHSGMFELH